ncbi:MAG: TlpA family protein disulfide reductase [Gammaproteobacteria bacterium]|jgi:peroxiredoxin|nr:TlpA family protein disulfide reductase [Gammaproteobacteria bacterium]MBT3489088.1 TlpA family protein disulfide reductase [Gammaproteobacteria bacterium]MBT3719115.1 TlpA family protein disulfide reductase [Gammaproteobacteria bacterium]MBT3843551.1 TlpA family protein disulfide reductase [Gammaproteobacteria bacterium]MBT3892749.1 TlpA family protein disulfide reductase [Gammaproteobacteria bacterium]
MRLLILFILTQMLSTALFAESREYQLTRVEGGMAPDFRLMDINENLYVLSDYQGNPVIVNFWATWCPPCRAEMPAMQRAWEQLEKEGVLMLAINVGEDEDAIFPFTAEYPVEFPLLMDLDSTVIQQWGVRGLPTTFIVDPDGMIVYRAVGGREWDHPKILEVILSLRQK